MTADADRFAGCLLGGAVGDALGAPVEFMSSGSILARFGAGGIADYAPAYGRIGAITDDTQMTLWTAEGLLRAASRERAGEAPSTTRMIHRAYWRWLATQGGRSRDPDFAEATRATGNGWLIGVRGLHASRAPGNTCLSALTAPGMGTMDDPRNDSKGCGGVMRAAPAGLWESDPRVAFRLGCEAAAITHSHPSGYLSAGCLAAMISRIREGVAVREAALDSLAILAEYPSHGECLAAMRQALAAAEAGGRPSVAAVESLGGGWVGEEALAMSVYCCLVFPGDFPAAVRLAVNHGGDSDSTGAIAGNLLGAALGAGAIPSPWIEQLELAEEIRILALDLFTRGAPEETRFDRYPPT